MQSDGDNIWVILWGRNIEDEGKRCLTRACWASRSLVLSSLSLASFSCLRSGNFSIFVLFRRLTMGFSRFSTCIRFTFVNVSDLDDEKKKKKKPRAYLSLILESDLSNSHTAILLQVGPRRINDRDVILFVAYDKVSKTSSSSWGLSSLSQFLHNRTKQEQEKTPEKTFTSKKKISKQHTHRHGTQITTHTNVPSILFAFVNCAQSTIRSLSMVSQSWPSGSRT